MSRYYCNYTFCIECEDIEAIKKAIIKLLEYDRGKNISRLPDSIEQSLKYWIVELFPSNCGWTIIKTWSYELLCSQTIDIYQLRLSDLAIQIKCNAFYLSVYDGIYGILLEANAIGEIHISGCYHPNFRTETFYNQRIDKLGLIKKFYLLEVPDLFKSAIQVNHDLELQKKSKNTIA